MTDLSTLSDADLAALYRQTTAAPAAPAAAPAASPLAGLSDQDLIALHRQAPPEASPVNGTGFTRALYQGLTGGLLDEVSASGRATGAYLAGKPGTFGENYDRFLAAERGANKDYSSAHPVLSAVGDTAGSLAGMRPAVSAATAVAKPVAEGAGRVGTYLKNILTAAGFGAGSGFASGEGGFENRMGGAAAGAAAGGATAGAAPLAASVIGKIAGKVGSALGMRDADDAAMNQLMRAFERDGVAPEQALQKLQAWQDAGAKPEMLFDLGGENVRGLARGAAGTPSEARATAVQALKERQAGQEQRIAEDTAKFLNPDVDYYQTVDNLVKFRKDAAAPKYDAAYKAEPINPDEVAAGGPIADLMRRPSMRAAVGRAQKIAAEEGRDPASLGLNLDADGNVKFTKVPSWQTLDYVKRGLDDVVESFRDPTSGKLVLDEAGRAINATRGAFVSRLRELNPAYADALNSYSGPSGSLDALRLGRGVFNQDSEVTARRIADMSEGDREFLRAGVARAIRDRLDNTADGADAVKKFFNTPAVRKKMEAAFDNPQQFALFKAAVDREANMYANAQAVSPKSGSQTALRLAETGDMGDDVATGFFGHLMNTHRVLPATALTVKDYLARRGQSMNADTADALARVLYTPDAATNARTLMDLAQRRQRMGSQDRNDALVRALLATGGAASGTR